MRRPAPENPVQPGNASRPATDSAARGCSRRTAGALLLLLLAVALALRVAELRVGLPSVYHSDFEQIEQVVRLVQTGSFADSHMYPVAQVYLYAAAALVLYALGRLSGVAPWNGFDEFAEAFGQPLLYHAFGRAVGALCGSLLVIAVYRLARLRFDRATSLLAAAAAALAPLHVLYAHQVRPHAVAVLVLLLAARPALALTLPGATRATALAAGAAAGVAAAVFQYGFLLVATAGLQVLVLVRPLRRALHVLPVLGVGFGVSLGAMALVTRIPGVLLPGEGATTYDNAGRLGLYEGQVALRFDQCADLLRALIAAEPALVAAAAAFFASALAVPARRGDVLRFGLFPASSLAALGAFVGAWPRYTLAATPFLAIPAAAWCLELPTRRWRALAAAVLLLVPAAVALRADRLLGSTDTRMLLRDACVRAGRPPGALKILVDDKLVPGLRSFDRWFTFPPDGAYREWQQGISNPRHSFAAIGPQLWLRTACGWEWTGLNDRAMDLGGWTLVGRIRGAPPATTPLPDVPQHLIPALWRIQRMGPSIDLWAETPEAIEWARRVILCAGEKPVARP